MSRWSSNLGLVNRSPSSSSVSVADPGPARQTSRLKKSDYLTCTSPLRRFPTELPGCYRAIFGLIGRWIGVWERLPRVWAL